VLVQAKGFLAANLELLEETEGHLLETLTLFLNFAGCLFVFLILLHDGFLCLLVAGHLGVLLADLDRGIVRSVAVRLFNFSGSSGNRL